MISPYFHMAGDEARGLLYGLVEADKLQLRKHPGMPSVRKLIADGKLRYRRADPNEHWQTYKELVDQVEDEGIGYGDCEDFATAIAAEDQVRYGVLSLPYAYNPREGLFHVVVAVPEDSYGALPPGHWPGARGADHVSGYVLQDPSAAAGMGESFGGDLPAGAQMTRYGALPNAATDQKKGLSAILGAFKRGLVGEETAASAAYQLGAGARKGGGVEEGWAKKLGEGLGARVSPAAPAGEAPEGSSDVKQATDAMDDGVDLDDVEEEFGATAKRGLGSIISSFQKGLIGEETLVSAAHQLGAGAKKGSGLEGGWATKLGEQLGGRVSPVGGPSSTKGGGEEAPSGSEDEDLDDLDDDLEDESFGLFGRMWFQDDPDLYPSDDVTIGDEEAAEGFGVEAEDFVGGAPWNMDRIANLVADDITGQGYGGLDLGDRIEGDYQMGIFQRYMDEPTDFSHEDLLPSPPPRFGRLDAQTRKAMGSPHGMAALKAATFLKEAGLLEVGTTPQVSGMNSMSLKTRVLRPGEHALADSLAASAGATEAGVFVFWNEPEDRRYLTFTSDPRDFVGHLLHQIHPVKRDLYVEPGQHYGFEHLVPPSHMQPPGHMQPPSHMIPDVRTRPVVTFGGDDHVDAADGSGDFGFERTDLFGFDEDDDLDLDDDDDFDVFGLDRSDLFGLDDLDDDLLGDS